MNDVVIVGGGDAGMAVGAGCMSSSLSVLIIDDSSDKPDSWQGEWIKGKGVVSAKGLVVILDPETGDEKRIVQAQAVVVAVGRLDNLKSSHRMLGITKIGATQSADGQSIITDSKGRTRAVGIYAAGSCASFAASEIVEDIRQYCISAPTNIG